MSVLLIVKHAVNKAHQSPCSVPPPDVVVVVVLGF